MKKIIKTQSPKEFEKWKFEYLKNEYEIIIDELKKEVESNTSFDKGKIIKKLKDSEKWGELSGIPKQKLKESLLLEQGYICAYCGKRISYKNTKVEHIAPRSSYKRHQFDYQNLVLSCSGNEEDKNSKVHHCDKRKGAKEIKVNPVHDCYEWEDNFCYHIDGSITTKTNNNDYKNALEILNLNNNTLLRKRKAALKGLLIQPVKKEDGTIKREYVKFSYSDLKKLSYSLKEKSSDGKYFPYCEAVASMLELESIKEKDRLLKDQLIKIKEALEKEGVDPVLIKRALKI